MKQPQLLSPLPEIHLRFFQIHALNRSLAFTTRSARETFGCGNCNGIESTAFNWSTIIAIIRRSAKALLLNRLNLQACRISSRNSAETFITKHFSENFLQSLGRKYRVLIETGPDISTECGVFAGIHTARSGGTTQTPCFVRSVITPLDANNSWSSG